MHSSCLASNSTLSADARRTTRYVVTKTYLEEFAMIKTAVD
jgi:hypothetical protein